MLTIKSNFINFKNRQGESYTIDDLTLLTKALIKEDITNFKLKYVGGGFTAMIANKIYSKLTISNNGIVVIINDLSLHMVNKLLAEGYKKENIYLAYGKWNIDGSISDDSTVCNTMKTFIKANIKERLNVITLKELFDMDDIKIDGIIANPPYGKIGANITKTIIDKVDYVEFVNLLPANDYKRNKTKDLYNYQSGMEAINDGFDDAAVTTHLAILHKTKVNSMTEDEFERSNYIDRSLDKYFEENSKRSHYAIDAAIYKPKLNTFKQIFDLQRCIFIGKRYVSDEHLPYTKNCAGYKINVERSLDHDELINMSAKSEQALGNVGDFSLIQFATEIEQINIAQWLYSKAGYKFFAKVVCSINADSYIHVKKFLPKVDWTRSWTVEEILRDYSYTEEEITEVMNDLDNFKGMND